jgi:translation initiation factor 2 alpha subunit (eIF-2alpha)
MKLLLSFVSIVIKVDFNQYKKNYFRSIFLGYIDLSKRRVSPEDISKCEERFVRGKTVRFVDYFQ